MLVLLGLGVKRPLAYYEFSCLLTITYFLCALVKRLDKMLQISTHHCLVSDNGLLLIAGPPLFTSSSTSISSSSTSLPVIKFLVYGECGIYFGRGWFVTFHEIETHPQNLIWSRFAEMESSQRPHPSDPRLHYMWSPSILIVDVLFYVCQEKMYLVSWCTIKVCLFMFYTKLTKQSPNNPHQRCKKTGWDMIRCIGGINCGHIEKTKCSDLQIV
jgi:hypothetical protein